MTLRFPRPTNGKLAAEWCPNCDAERPVTGGRCLVCGRKVTVKLSKFGNRPADCSEGFRHQSQAEAARCSELHLLQSAGLISGLQAHPQPAWDIVVNGVKVCRYVSDFAYDQRQGATTERVVEDVKGWATDVYRLKARLMLACYGIKVVEVRAKRGERRRAA